MLSPLPLSISKTLNNICIHSRWEWRYRLFIVEWCRHECDIILEFSTGSARFWSGQGYPGKSLQHSNIPLTWGETALNFELKTVGDTSLRYFQDVTALPLACTSGNARWRMKTSCEAAVKTEVLKSISQ
jgi:hypothetical protein